MEQLKPFELFEASLKARVASLRDLADKLQLDDEVSQGKHELMQERLQKCEEKLLEAVVEHLQAAIDLKGVQIAQHAIGQGDNVPKELYTGIFKAIRKMGLCLEQATSAAQQFNKAMELPFHLALAGGDRSKVNRVQYKYHNRSLSASISSLLGSMIQEATSLVQLQLVFCHLERFAQPEL